MNRYKFGTAIPKDRIKNIDVQELFFNTDLATDIMSEYHKEVARILEEPRLWAEFRRSDFLLILDNSASEAFQKQTLEGYLAAF